jgi:hypothetical protein
VACLDCNARPQGEKTPRCQASRSSHDCIVVFCGDFKEVDVQVFPSAEYARAYRDGFHVGSGPEGDWKAYTLDDLIEAAMKGGGK